MTHRSRIVIGFVAVLLFLGGWLWLADRFFDGPTTEFSVQHERGALALVEQIGAALYTPAWFVWELAFSRSQTLDRGPLFLICVLQLWPAFVVAFRPWQRLSLISRRIILGYCGVCLLAVINGFAILHSSWERLFGP